MIDCDVHNNWSSADVLRPYLPPAFREYLERGELPGERGSFPHAHRPWLHPEGFKRNDAVPPAGGPAGSDYAFLCEQLLDRYAVEYAVLTGEEAIEVSTLANPYYAQALASAYNDWLVENWLSLDRRLKGSLVVAPQDPEGAAKEIRRLGGHPDIVQVLVSSGSQKPYGDTFYHPIWDACAELDLPLAAHLGGQGGVNANPTGCGPPTFFWEAHALLCETGMGHVASTIAHGVFERWPNARLVLVECGIAWLPAILWRLDADYRALRKETPWLKRLPSEYAREHVRLTTQPLEQPRQRAALWPALEDVGADDILLFASDYPHWDFDSPTVASVPPTWREKVMRGNARTLYGLPPAERPGGEEVLASAPGHEPPGACARRHVVCGASEIPPGGRRIVEVDGRSIGVFNVAGRFYALHNGCPHRGGALCEGPVTGTVLPTEDRSYAYGRDGEILRCAWHGWEFDIPTGRSLVDPAVCARTYPVTVVDGTVVIAV